MRSVLIMIFALSWSCSSDDASVTYVHRGHPVEVWASDLVGAGFDSVLWRLETPAGSATDLRSGAGEMTSFVPDISGIYVVRIQATDGDIIGEKARTYYATNGVPQVTIKADPIAFIGQQVAATIRVLDENNDSVTASWTLTGPDGQAAPFSTPDAASLLFTASLNGAYSIRVVVDDGEATSEVAVAKVDSVTPLEELSAEDYYRLPSAAYSSKHETLMVTDGRDLGVDDRVTEMHFFAAGAATSSLLTLPGLAAGLAVDATGDHVATRVGNHFYLIDVSTRAVLAQATLGSSSSQRPERYIHSSPGLLFGLRSSRLIKEDIVNETHQIAMDVTPTSRSLAFAPARSALYLAGSGSSIDPGVLLRVDPSSPENVHSFKEMPLQTRCARTIFPIAGGNRLLRDDGVVFRTSEATSEDMEVVGELPVGCIEQVHEQVALGRAVIADKDARSAIALVDTDAMEVLRTYSYALVRDGEIVSVTLQDLFLDSGGQHVYLVLRVYNGGFVVAKATL